METFQVWERDFSWSSIPTKELLAELSRRADTQHGSQHDPRQDEQPQCAGSETRGSYDTGIHVFALVLILILSTLACAFPLFSRRFSTGRKQRYIIFLFQHFGTGVLLATAFVHLLPTAFTSLTDPCLPWIFSKGYRPLAGLIAMVSALVVVALESYLTTRGAGHSHSHHRQIWDSDDDGSDNGVEAGLHPDGQRFGTRPPSIHCPVDIMLGDMETQGLVAGVSPLPESWSPETTQPANGKGSFGDLHDNDSESYTGQAVRESLDLELELDELNPNQNGSPHHSQEARQLTKRSSSNPTDPSVPHVPHQEEQKRLLLQCLLLEAGILFHSVFIGMALSVATGPTFAVFLIAITFHQSFEGLALGSRIAAIQFQRSSPRPWLMVLAYGATTPIGQAIGLFVHKLYDPMSQTGLLMVGFMNAISSGLLLFAGLVQLLAEDFLTEKSYQTLHGRKRVNAFLAVAGGAGLMAAVGALA